MTRTGIASELYVDCLLNLRSSLVGATSSLCFADENDPRSDAMLLEQAEVLMRTKGNRGDNVPVRFADLRMMMISTLEICLKHLEAAHD